MTQNTIKRWLRMAALAATTALAFGSLAWGQSYGYDDYYNRNHEAREQGYRNGFRAGQRQGQHDFERGRRFKFKNDDWEDSRGYEHWMGDKRDYKYAYPDGYEQGYRRSYGNYGDRYRDRDDHRWHDRDDWR